MVIYCGMEKRTPAGQSMTDLILEIFRLNGSLLNAGNHIAKPFGLTSARWQVIGAIELADQPLTVAQIARRMGLSRQGVQRIVNDLKNLQMVVMKANIDHKRSPLVAISKKGKTVMAKMDQAQIAWVNQLSKGIGEQDIKQTYEVIQAIRDRTDSFEN